MSKENAAQLAEFVNRNRQWMSQVPLTFAKGAELVAHPVQYPEKQMVRWFALLDSYRNSYIMQPTAKRIAFSISPPFLMQCVMAIEMRLPDVKVGFDLGDYAGMGETNWELSPNDVDAYIVIDPPNPELAAHAYDTLVEIFLELLGPESDEEPHVKKLVQESTKSSKSSPFF